MSRNRDKAAQGTAQERAPQQLLKGNLDNEAAGVSKHQCLLIRKNLVAAVGNNDERIDEIISALPEFLFDDVSGHMPTLDALKLLVAFGDKYSNSNDIITSALAPLVSKMNLGSTDRLGTPGKQQGNTEARDTDDEASRLRRKIEKLKHKLAKAKLESESEDDEANECESVRSISTVELASTRGFACVKVLQNPAIWSSIPDVLYTESHLQNALDTRYRSNGEESSYTDHVAHVLKRLLVSTTFEADASHSRRVIIDELERILLVWKKVPLHEVDKVAASLAAEEVDARYRRHAKATAKKFERQQEQKKPFPKKSTS